LPKRILILGNSGSGKSTYAKQIADREGLTHVDLDPYAWRPTDPPIRRAVEDSLKELRAALPGHGWVVEGCYADLVEGVSHDADLLLFLNPGVEACVRHCRARPFESHKYETPEAQDQNLAMLIEWVRGYDTREGPMSLAGHRAVFDGFEGEKRELRDPASWSA
jgi:adenylate kinase family enzyme